ncbi:hypothetical protein H6F55_20910 [Phormidium sp. FACHB-322]|nr:hypothetical protein [Phormidium sp. FACHB-77]MBD2032450.1 hypothetical protein [Phormidium sp. FACHB-322]MBD2051019.1 hypothetical protein [Leptolyngbya sp. FACHB-60]
MFRRSIIGSLRLFLKSPITEPGREKVMLTVRGPAYAVERVIHELYRVGFAEVHEWSKPIPTGKLNEIMRVLTRYVIFD